VADEFDRRRRFVGNVVCALAFAFIVWSFYPGVMTADSIANLTQGRMDSYSDINAPLMSWFWGRLDTIVSGPALIFVIHLAIFWTACALFWSATSSRSLWLGLALVLFGLTPHILSQTVVVWKDVALGVSLFLAVALVYRSRTNGSKLALLVSPVFLFYGYAARLNAFPAVLPIAIWTGYVACEVFAIEKKKLAAGALGFGYFAVVSLGVYFVNHRLTDGRMEYPFQQVYLYDLAAISVEQGEPRFPGYVTEAESFSLETVTVRYNERSVSDLIFPNVPNAGDHPPLKLTSDAGKIEALRDKWLDEITKNPMTYMRHRTRVFSQLIGTSPSVTAPYVADGFANNPPEFRGSENFGYAVLMKYFGAFRRPFPQTFFFRAIVWMALCVVLAYVAIRRRLREDWDLVFVLSISGLLFTFAYFPTTPSTEFRYLFWPAIASAVALIFGVYQWWLELVRGRSDEFLSVLPTSAGES
jgi:hypothetical protein